MDEMSELAEALRLAKVEYLEREAVLVARIAEKQDRWERVFAELAPAFAGTITPRC